MTKYSRSNFLADRLKNILR